MLEGPLPGIIPAFVLGACSTGGSGMPSDQPFFVNDMNDSESRFIDVNGVRTHYYERGEFTVWVL